MVEAEMREQVMKLENEIESQKTLISKVTASSKKLEKNLSKTEEKIAEKNRLNDQISAYNEAQKKAQKNKEKKIKIKKKPKVEKPKVELVQVSSSSDEEIIEEKPKKAPKAPKAKKPNPKNVAKLQAKTKPKPKPVIKATPVKKFQPVNSNLVKKNSNYTQHSTVNYFMATIDYSDLLQECIKLHEEEFSVILTVDELKALARHESLQHHANVSSFASSNTQKFIKKNAKLSDMLKKLDATDKYLMDALDLTEKNLRVAYIIAQIECLEKAVKHNEKTEVKREEMREKLISAF